MVKIIGLIGLAQSGKSTVAQHLSDNHGFVRIRFAGPLKAMCRSMGLTDREIEGDGKEAPHMMLCGKTPRYVMQTLGTEWGRELIGPDFWTGIWRESVMAAIDQGAKGIVAEDCRFPNEIEAVRSLGGEVWQIIRPGAVKLAHISESASSEIDPDFIIHNTGKVRDLITVCDLSL